MNENELINQELAKAIWLKYKGHALASTENYDQVIRQYWHRAMEKDGPGTQV